MIEHPNEQAEADSSDEEKEKKPYYTWVDSGLVHWYGRFDKTVLRPWFVRQKGILADKEDIDNRFKSMKTFKVEDD